LTEINLTRPTGVLLAIAGAAGSIEFDMCLFWDLMGFRPTNGKWAGVQRLRERGSEGEKRTA